MKIINFKPEIIKTRIPILGVFVFAMVALFGYAYYRHLTASVIYNIEIWQDASQLLVFIFPLIVVLPTCGVLYSERQNGFITYTRTRIQLKKYYLIKFIHIEISAFLMVFLLSVLLLLFSLFVLPGSNPPADFLPDDYNALTKHFLGEYAMGHPLLYGLILSAWRGFLGAIISGMGFVFARYLNNVFVILFAPFAIVEVISFALGILLIPEYGITYSFVPDALSAEGVSWVSIFTGPISYIILITAMYFVLKIRDKKTVTAQ
jgi:hypothetical protein